MLGHSSIATTMICTHKMARPDVRVVSPLDRLVRTAAEGTAVEGIAAEGSVSRVEEVRGAELRHGVPCYTEAQEFVRPIAGGGARLWLGLCLLLF